MSDFESRVRRDATRLVTEAKVKASATAVLILALVGQALLAGTVTDYVPMLPDWAEVPVYSVIAAGAAWLAGWAKSSVTGKLAPSTIEAVEREIGKRL